MTLLGTALAGQGQVTSAHHTKSDNLEANPLQEFDAAATRGGNVAYNAWAATAFPAGSGPDVTGPTADPDKDGNLNPIECLTGTNPGLPGGSPLTVQELPGGGIRLTFPRRTGVPEGFETIESATAPEGIGDPVGRSAITRTSNGAGQTDTVTVELPGGEDQRFMRGRAGW